MSKCSAILLILLLVNSSSLMSSLVCAATAKPPVPEFTLKIVARPYDVPPTATMDPYTGQTSITHGGYHVENKSIDVIIKNQPSVSYYQIKLKGFFSTDWYTYSALIPNSMESTIYLTLSDGDYTVVSVPFNYWGENFPQGGKVDFQVRALIGQTFEQIMGQVRGIFFDGQTGDWSATQTITIDANPSAENPDISFPYQSLLPLESQNPTSNQSSTQVVIQLGVDWMQIVTLALLGIIAVLLATVAALQLKRRKK